MALGFMIGGTLIAILGIIAAVRQGAGTRRRRRPAATLPEPMAVGAEQNPEAQARAQAFSVLQEPVVSTGGFWGNLADSGPPRQFKIGLLVGLGVGLAVAGLLFAVLPDDPSPRPAAASPGTAAPQVGGKAVDGGSPATKAASAPPAVGGQSPPTAKSGTAVQPPTPAAGDPAVFVVQPGENAVNIANRLVEQGFVSNRQAFLDRVTERKADVRLQVGQFRLRPGMSVDAIIDMLAP